VPASPFWPHNSQVEKVADNVPAVNCANFEKRVYECTNDFLKTYSATKFAEKVSGANVAEKTVALKSGLKMLKNLKGQNACENMPVWGNLTQKDPKWRVRYNKCKPDASCADWGKCVGEALGNPL
jgi:hypothetical protein